MSAVFLTNRTNRVLSVTGTADGYIGAAAQGTTVPFLIQYIGPNEEKSATR